MNNNYVNLNNQENNQKPCYVSSTLMTRDMFYDFYLVNYNRIKKMYLFFLMFTVFQIIMNNYFGNFNIVSTSLIVSFCSSLIYYKAVKSTKIGYERNLLSAGKEATLNYTLFDNKIISCVDEFKREYKYNQITKFFETKSFLLLHLKHNMYITVDKTSINANIDEVKAFLIKKCTLVKKKKFINCSNNKKLSLVYLIALIALSIIGTTVSVILKYNLIG